MSPHHWPRIFDTCCVFTLCVLPDYPPKKGKKKNGQKRLPRWRRTWSSRSEKSSWNIKPQTKHIHPQGTVPGINTLKIVTPSLASSGANRPLALIARSGHRLPPFTGSNAWNKRLDQNTCYEESADMPAPVHGAEGRSEEAQTDGHDDGLPVVRMYCASCANEQENVMVTHLCTECGPLCKVWSH